MVYSDDFEISVGTIDRDLSLAGIWDRYEKEKEQFDSDIDAKARRPISTFKNIMRRERAELFQSKAEFGLAIVFAAFKVDETPAHRCVHTHPFKGGGGRSALINLCKYLYGINCLLERHTTLDHEIKTTPIDYEDLTDEQKEEQYETWGVAFTNGFKKIEYTHSQRECLDISRNSYGLAIQFNKMLSLLKEMNSVAVENIEKIFEITVRVMKDSIEENPKENKDLHFIRENIRNLILVCVRSNLDHPLLFSDFKNFAEYGDSVYRYPEYTKNLSSHRYTQDSYGYRNYLMNFSSSKSEDLKGVFGLDPLEPLSTDEKNSLELKAREVMTAFHTMLNPSSPEDGWIIKFKIIQNLKSLRELINEDEDEREEDTKEDLYRKIIERISEFSSQEEFNSLSIFDPESFSEAEKIPVPPVVTIYEGEEIFGFKYYRLVENHKVIEIYKNVDPYFLSLCQEYDHINFRYSGSGVHICYENTIMGSCRNINLIWGYQDGFVSIDSDGDVGVRDNYCRVRSVVTFDGFRFP